MRRGLVIIALASQASHRARARTILVVEDDIFVRLMIAGELRERGFRVVEAASGDERSRC